MVLRPDAAGLSRSEKTADPNGEQTTVHKTIWRVKARYDGGEAMVKMRPRGFRPHLNGGGRRHCLFRQKTTITVTVRQQRNSQSAAGAGLSAWGRLWPGSRRMVAWCRHSLIPAGLGSHDESSVPAASEPRSEVNDRGSDRPQESSPRVACQDRFPQGKV